MRHDNNKLCFFLNTESQSGEKCSGGGRVADEPIDRLMWPDAILSRRSNAVFIIQMYLNHSWKKVGILATGCRR